jgi:hypothetical protein
MSKTIQNLSKNIIRTQVNDNMEELFDLPHEEIPLVDNQILQKSPTKKKGRGGARPNSGRKLGSTVKLSAADLLAEIERQDKPFAEGLAEDYLRARQSGDLHIVQRYQQMFLSKVLADKSELDVTSKGEQLGVQLVFNSVELPEWNK